MAETKPLWSTIVHMPSAVSCQVCKMGTKLLITTKNIVNLDEFLAQNRIPYNFVWTEKSSNGYTLKRTYMQIYSTVQRVALCLHGKVQGQKHCFSISVPNLKTLYTPSSKSMDISLT